MINVGKSLFYIKFKFFILPERSEGGVLKFCIGICSRMLTCVLLSVKSSSSHTIEARGLKFGMHNPNMDGSKATDQIFDILLRSREN